MRCRAMRRARFTSRRCERILERRKPPTSWRRDGLSAGPAKKKKPAGSSPAGLIVQKAIEGPQYIRGDPSLIALTDAEVFRAGLVAHAVDLRFIGKLLAFIERALTCTFDGADVNENVGAAIIGLDEAEALGCVE